MLCDYCGYVICFTLGILSHFGYVVWLLGPLVWYCVFDYLTFTVLLWLHKQIIVLDTSGK